MASAALPPAWPAPPGQLAPQALLLPSRHTELHEHHLVKEGAIILQDKASCLAPAALAPRAGEIVLDCCAAPGNKTTQVVTPSVHIPAIAAVLPPAARARARARTAPTYAVHHALRPASARARSPRRFAAVTRAMCQPLAARGARRSGWPRHRV